MTTKQKPSLKLTKLTGILKCSLCAEDLNPETDDFVIFNYKDIHGNDTTKLYSRKCIKLEKNILPCCDVCGNIPKTPEFSHILPSAIYKSVQTTVLCSSVCRNIYIKAMRKCEDLQIMAICTTCGKNQKKMDKCSRCRDVYYCSKECQKSDWKSHKITCNMPS